MAIAPAGHPLLRKARVSVRDICKESLILREEGSGTHAVVDRALRKRGVKINPPLSLASPEAIKNTVASELGLAIVSRLIASLAIQIGSPKLFPLVDLKIPRPLHLQRIRGRSQSPAVVKFLEVLAARTEKPARCKR